MNARAVFFAGRSREGGNPATLSFRSKRAGFLAEARGNDGRGLFSQ
jgi:hypothetical protein